MAKKGEVLAFEKKLVVSDGYMYGTTWEDRSGKAVPVRLQEKSVRGTISNRLKGAVKNDPAKLNEEIQKANLQTVDSASLTMDEDTLKLEFTVKVLSGVQYPSACNDPKHYESIKKMGEDFIAENGFKELSRRYALNLANGRFLWRNRVGAEKIEVHVVALKEDGVEKEWIFDAYDFSLKDFGDTSDDVEELAGLITEALCGERNYLLLKVTAFAFEGQGQEVYPSEEMILNKDKVEGREKKSKILYQVNDIAAMHSQKLGNAIRAIDTWYPSFDEVETGPIAVEPYGAVTNMGMAYRTPKEKKDFYTLFDDYSNGVDLDSDDDKNYVMAVLVRGGVFGKNDEE
jgi:CRISPR-associated protein Csy3